MDKKQISLKKFPTISSEDMLKIYGGDIWKKIEVFFHINHKII